MLSATELTDDLFEAQFKNGTLDPAVFDHEAHLRLAWIHITKYGVDAAMENISTQLYAFVTALGAKDKYNHTLTIAAVKAVGHFVSRSDQDNFAGFIQQFPRLKTDFKGLMRAHYGIDIFNSATAKQQWLEPDLLPFN